MIERFCKLCNKSFYAYRNRIKREQAIFCSRKCLYIFKRKNRTRECKICNKEFLTTNWQEKKGFGKYCSKICFVKSISGSNSPAWKGGKRIDNDGYVYLYMPNHPMSLKSTKCVAEHRLVMSQKLKRLLASDEQVHHKNGIKDDNRLENLEIIKKRPHAGKTICPQCNFEFYVR